MVWLLKFFKGVLWFLGGIISFVLLYLGAAWLLGQIPVNNHTDVNIAGIELFVISNGVHTDICIPAVSPTFNWNELIPPTTDHPPFSESSYLAFGWGDKGFYLETPTWADLTVSVALRAALLPSPTAMHVTHYSQKPTPGTLVRSVVLDTAHFAVLTNYIKDSFTLDNRKQAQLIDCCSYGNYDRFFEAQGSYHLFFTCNNWTNKGLKQAKVRCPIWSPFDQAILNQVSEK